MRGRSITWAKEPKNDRKKKEEKNVPRECSMADDIIPNLHQLPHSSFSALRHTMSSRKRLVPCARCRGRDPSTHRKIASKQSLTTDESGT